MITVKPQVPIQTVVPDISSTSKHFIRSRNVEILPNSQVNYSYSGNNQIEFTISSGQDFIDFSNSYLRFDVTCALNNNGADDTAKYLSEGGIHSVFREVRLETASGTVIERVDRYNKLYALLSQFTQSKEMVDRTEFASGDGSCFQDFVAPCDLKDAFFDSDTGTVGAVGGIADPDFRVVYTGVIGANASGDPGSSMKTPTRKKVANTESIAVMMKPLLSFMSLSQIIPLYLIRGGCRLVMVLDNPATCLATPSTRAGTGFAGANVTLSNARYIARMITPSEELTSMYISKFNTSGMAYPLICYKHFLDILGSGTGVESKQIFSNVRSARFVLQRLQVASLETADDNTTAALNSYSFDSCAIGLKENLKEYQFSSGSKQFPVFKVQVDDIGQYEAFNRLLQAVGVYGSSMTQRFDPYEWTEDNAIMGITDSTRFAIGEDLSRDKSVLTGTDLQTVPLNYELNFDDALTIGGALQSRYLHTFVGYDTLVSISSSGVIVRS